MKEVKIGLLTIFVLAIVIWGYKFIKGENMFSKSLILNAQFDDVTGLDVSSLVYLNGFKIGSVQNITLNQNNIKEMLVSVRIEGDYKIPKTAKLVMRSDGLVSGQALELRFDKLCTGEDCASTGDILESSKMGLLATMMNPEELDDYTGQITKAAKEIISDLGNEVSDAPLNTIIRELSVTMSNMSKLTASTNSLLEKTTNSMDETMKNIASITQNLVNNNAQISSLLQNINQLTGNMKQFDFAALNSNSQESMANLQNTLSNASDTFENLNKLLIEIDRGNGSLTKFIKDEQLYNNMEKTSQNLSLLLQDMRLNPKRYVSISVFGKKQKEYVPLEDDPAYRN